jgi:predicted 3-demethylubiquinone-9 3-methyltransferase (glyoxalase superfamily)
MSTTVTPILMFTGQAEAAMNLYVSLFSGGKVLEVTRYGADQGEREGTIMKASFSIGSQTLHCIDSPPVHDFTFTPSFSLWVDCESEDEIKRLYDALSQDGKAMMPLGDYGFSRQFGWISDRYGVSWQLNLAA